MEHYRCYQVYTPQIRGELIADTIELFPRDIPVPSASSVDRIIKAAEELATVLRNPAPAAPFNTFGEDTSEPLQQLSNIFSSHSKVTRH